MSFDILNRWTGAVLYTSATADDIATAMVEAVASSANLRSANLSSANLSSADLSGADLSSANLSSANLSSANLSSANLRSANLSSANLSSADLRGADLSSADLSGADLSSANLRSANLSSANLSSANLSSADLSSANLRSANLSSAKADFLAEVLKLPNELEFLRSAIIEGRINGSSYSGECACLAGTLAHAKGLDNYHGGPITNGCTFNADAYSPRERFFLAIAPGNTPENNGASAIALEWTNEAIRIRDNIRAHKPQGGTNA